MGPPTPHSPPQVVGLPCVLFIPSNGNTCTKQAAAVLLESFDYFALKRKTGERTFGALDGAGTLIGQEISENRLNAECSKGTEVGERLGWEFFVLGEISHLSATLP